MGRFRPPSTGLTRTEPTTRRPSRVASSVSTGPVRSSDAVARSTASAKPPREPPLDESHGYGPADGTSAAVQPRSAVNRSLTSSTVPSRSRITQGVVQALEDRPAPRRVLGAGPRSLEVARDPGPQLEHRERLDEVVVGAGDRARCSSPVRRPAPTAGSPARRPGRAHARMASTRAWPSSRGIITSLSTRSGVSRHAASRAARAVVDQLDVVVVGEQVGRGSCAGRRCPPPRRPGADRSAKRAGSRAAPGAVLTRSAAARSAPPAGSRRPVGASSSRTAPEDRFGAGGPRGQPHREGAAPTHLAGQADRRRPSAR